MEKKQPEELGLLLKQGKVTISIKALTKVEFFRGARPWDEKRVCVYGNEIKERALRGRITALKCI